jgi:hypothetical protein
VDIFDFPFLGFFFFFFIAGIQRYRISRFCGGWAGVNFLEVLVGLGGA